MSHIRWWGGPSASAPNSPSALRIDHIGSTAVPGLAAKDVSDVQITVSTLEKSALVAALSTLGYFYNSGSRPGSHFLPQKLTVI